jgi:hypothetical protein
MANVRRYVIGLDPGKQTGYALYDLGQDGGKLIDLQTLTFWEAYARVLSLGPEMIRAVMIEAPKNKHVFHQPGANAAANQRMGVHVGSVLREAELLADGLEAWGIPVKRLEPVGKKDAAAFKKAFPYWTGRTNQHVRDAAFMTLRKLP